MGRKSYATLVSVHVVVSLVC